MTDRLFSSVGDAHEMVKQARQLAQVSPLDLEIDLDYIYSKTCVKQPLSKIQKIGFQDQLSLNAGQKYCRMHYF